MKFRIFWCRKCGNEWTTTDLSKPPVIPEHDCDPEAEMAEDDGGLALSITPVKTPPHSGPPKEPD